MHRLEGLAVIFIVVLLLGIFVFWMSTIQHDDVTPTLERLIEAGYTIEEILHHPDVARINRKNPGLFPSLDEWTKDDLQRAQDHIETLPPARAATNVRSDAYGHLLDRRKKRLVVYEVIRAAQETHGEGQEPFTIKSSLPASVRADVEEAFGDAANAVLSQIEEAFATHDAFTHVFESDGGIEGYVNHLVKSQPFASDE